MKKISLYDSFANGMIDSLFDFDIFWQNRDFGFDHLIGLECSLYIRQLIYNDINDKRLPRIVIDSRYKCKVEDPICDEEIPEKLSYKFENEFFEELEIYHEYAKDFRSSGIIEEQDMFFAEYDNNTKKLIFRIKADHPRWIDTCKVRLALILGYYQYFEQNGITNEFTQFMNYIIKTNSHRPPNSTNVFESVVKDGKSRTPVLSPGTIS